VDGWKSVFIFCLLSRLCQGRCQPGTDSVASLQKLLPYILSMVILQDFLRGVRANVKSSGRQGYCTSNPSLDRVSAIRRRTSHLEYLTPHSFLPKSPLKSACRRRPAARINIQVPHPSTFRWRKKPKIRSVMYSTDYQLN
jgi:hypothetical protein